VNSVDWYRWHDSYDELGSPMTAVLADTQNVIEQTLDDAAPGTIRLLSMAAGQSRELIPVLVTHPRGADVSAVLIEYDHRNTDFAEGALQSAALEKVAVVTGDAGTSDSYEAGVPADVILCCGLFEHLSDTDTRQLVQAMPMLCADGAAVVYSHPDPVQRELLENHFRSSGFALTPTSPGNHVVGVATLVAHPRPWQPGVRMFDLI
jgi:hypothetical protein